MADTVEQAALAQWELKVFRDEAVLNTIVVNQPEITIGRELDNAVPLDDLKVSRYHARLMQRGELLMLEDLDSANGTFVNNEAITEPTALKSGDIIQIGPFDFNVKATWKPTPAPTPVPVAPPVRPEPAPRRIWPILLVLALLLGLLIFLLGGVLLAEYWITTGRTAAPTATVVPAAATSGRPSITISQSPGANSEIPVNQSITVQAIATDPTGIKRIELWVNGAQVDFVESPLAQNAESMTSSFQWSAKTPGAYNIEIRAYNESGLMSAAPAASISVSGGTDTPTPTPTTAPTPTSTPVPPTPEPTETPLPSPTSPPPTVNTAMLTVVAPLLNVRAGPGTQYAVIGSLPQNQQAQIVGQTTGSQGLWWQINFSAGVNGLAWVSGDPRFVIAQNTQNVPLAAVPLPPTPGAPAATGTATPTVTATSTPTSPPANVIRAPAGQMLLLVENRSLKNLPATLTLSGGKSVAGGKQINPPAGGRIEIALEPDFYRALWSAPNGFTRGADFTAVSGKVMVMWIVPEDGVTQTEMYDELVEGQAAVATPAAPTATPVSRPDGLVAPAGKALFVVQNRSTENEFALLTITGGNFGGGKEFVLNGDTETRLELDPAHYRTVWHTPVNGGMNAGREFDASAGDVILGWIIPEKRQAFMQFPGQPAIQINN